jgi:hypothetical protein
MDNRNPPQQAEPRLLFLIGLLLVLTTLGVYYPAVGGTFIVGDDNAYVTANRNVQEGLSLGSIRSAFTTPTMGNWHPLTMLSLEMDRSGFGPGPAALPLFNLLAPRVEQANDQLQAPGFHLTNLLLHAASACLLFGVLWRMTASAWPSAWVAALFALHPLHVESVAWVSERKDVLSGLFWMLTLLAYVWYTEAPSWGRYAWVVLAPTLGLMAKPMLVTLPCVLLLLDYWPLGRMQIADTSPKRARGPSLARRASVPEKGERGPSLTLWVSVLEKLPLFALSAAASGLALWAQHEGQALRTLADRPFALRLETAALAYGVYLFKMVWPVDLAPFYPFPPNGWPVWQVTAAVVVLLAVSGLAWRERRRCPYLMVGWLWYLVTLVPVIGLVPVGDQAWADRYTYLPSIGIFLMLAWGVPELAARCRLPQGVPAVLAAGTAILCIFSTRLQIGYWHDDERLWEHTLAVTSANEVAHNNLGTYLGNQASALGKQGKVGQANARLEEAIAHFAAAVAIDPRNANARANLERAQQILERQKSLP